MRSSAFRIFVCALVVIVFSANGFATEVADLSLSDILALKVFVASKTEEKAKDAPSSVTVFSDQEISALGVRTLEELLNFVPGFQTNREPNMIHYGIRGHSSLNAESLLLLIDGQRTNNVFTGGTTPFQHYIAVENIKQVEIVRGPGSALYGSNAFLAVVSIITKNGNSDAVFDVGSTYYRNAAANFSRTFGDLKISAFLKAKADDGYKFDPAAVGQATGMTIDPTTGDLREHSAALDANATATYKNLSVRFRNMERIEQGGWLAGVASEYMNQSKTRQTAVNFQFDQPLNDSMTLKTGGGYSREGWFAMGPVIPKGILGNTSVEYGGPFAEMYTANLTVDFDASVTETNRLLTGVLYEKEGTTNAKNLRSFDPLSPPPFADTASGLPESFTGEKNFSQDAAQRTIVGAYISDKQKFSDFLELTAGIRYDHYSDFGGTLNPRGAVVYSVLPIDSKVKFMYGQAFRAPAFVELYSKNNPAFAGNTALKPETVQTMELAYIQEFKGAKSEATVTYFRNKTTDIILPGSNTVGMAKQADNVGTEQIHGVELELKSQPFTNLIIMGSLSEIFEKEISAARHAASFAFDYRIGNFGFDLNGWYRGVNPAFKGRAPYTILNAVARYHYNANLSFNVNVRNLTDRTFQDISSLFGAGYHNPGRIWSVGMTMNL